MSPHPNRKLIMAIKLRNPRRAEFNMASMSDLVFLLLIFFMLTSTLVAPNAIKLLLPSSESSTMARQTTTVYINEENDIFLEEVPVDLEALQSGLVSCTWQGQAGRFCSVESRPNSTCTVYRECNRCSKHNKQHITNPSQGYSGYSAAQIIWKNVKNITTKHC
jgi:hypothetical protein